MGYAQYEVTRRDGIRIDAGYGVETVCEEKDCTTEIDRGLGYLCGQHPGGDEHGCGGYFCESHLFTPFINGEDRIPQKCSACYDAWETNRLNELASLIAERLEGMDGVKSAGEEDGKPRVLVELDNGFEVWLTLATS